MIAASNENCIVLTARDHVGASRSYELSSDQGVFVGKSANCGLQLPGDGIGDIHCRVGFEDGALQVQDWMSESGTKVNGAVIDMPTELRAGDVIEIGTHKITIGTQAASSNAVTVSDSERLETTECDDAFSDAESIIDDSDTGSGSEFTVEHLSDLAEPGNEDAVDFAGMPGDFSTDDGIGSDGAGLLGSDTIDFDADFSTWEEEETFDRETVELLKAEIEDLQAALAQRDSEQNQENEIFDESLQGSSNFDSVSDSEALAERMQDLIDEANRSDERVAMLEEMLHASEDSNRNEMEERAQLESWLSDIESRLSEREEEHTAELDALRQRLDQSQQEQDQLQRKLSQAAYAGNAPQQYEETLEKLQQANRHLQEQLDESRKDQASLRKQLEEAESDQDKVLREERASIAKEQARLSRMRFELSQKVAEVETLPKEQGKEEHVEMSHKFKALREHLREIHEQEKKEEAEASLTSRLAKLWKRVEY